MPTVVEPSSPKLSPDSAIASTYAWLLALGFPSDAAAASLMPNLFTTATPSVESRPGRLHLRCSS